jgi:hypothetical protein
LEDPNHFLFFTIEWKKNIQKMGLVGVLMDEENGIVVAWI